MANNNLETHFNPADCRLEENLFPGTTQHDEQTYSTVAVYMHKAVATYSEPPDNIYHNKCNLLYGIISSDRLFMKKQVQKSIES